jgi:hypothetical protein
MAVAIGVFLKQFTFNPAVLVATSAAPSISAPAVAAASGFSTLLPAELAEFGAPETFDADNLSDKIDGKADLYLTAGFVQMRCQRFALRPESLNDEGSSDDWMEWFVYDMGSLPQAFSVFSLQRRAEAKPLDLTEFAYKTQNALFFVCGRDYVEAVAATPGDRIMRAMVAMARNFVVANPPGDMQLPEIALFPKEDLLTNSYVLQIATAFGFDQFRNVFSAKYRVGDATVLAFVTVLANGDAANALRNAYHSFLIANGGKDVAGEQETAGAKTVEMFDGTEIVFSRGKVVAGIHAAPNPDAAQKVAAALERRVAEMEE